MNRFARSIVAEFLSEHNQRALANRIKSQFNDKNIQLFIDTDLQRRILNFSSRIERELSVSDPIEGATIANEVKAYNTQFLHETIIDIEKNISPNMTPHNVVEDIPQCNGRSGSDKPTPRPIRSPTEELNSWRDNPASLDQYRDDPQGVYRTSDRNRPEAIFRKDATTGSSACYNPMYDKPAEYCAVAQYGQNYCGNASNGYNYKDFGYLPTGLPNKSQNIAYPDKNGQLISYRNYKNPQDYETFPGCNQREYSGKWNSNMNVYPMGDPSYSTDFKKIPGYRDNKMMYEARQRQDEYRQKREFSNETFDWKNGNSITGGQILQVEKMTNPREGFANRQPRCERLGYESSIPSTTYCDQSAIGQGFAHDYQFGTFYSIQLNKDQDEYTQQPFGYSTPESDARLLSRRIFRKNEAGEENGIPRYEKRLYVRNLDRDIGETFQNTEYNYIQRGYDNDELYNRTNSKLRIADSNKSNYSIADQSKFLYDIQNNY